ncbi:MAG TPA: helical backbone metal receptor, partial [Pyrinomonadaceae bacterium]
MKRMLKGTKTKPAVVFAALLVALALLLGAGCGNAGPSAPAPAAKPARIVSLTPSTTEILHGVGAFGRVVAVSDYCTYPPEVNSLPRVGGWNNPNLEQIASLRPDLIVFSDAQAQFVKDKVEAAGIRTLSVPSQTLEDAYKAIEMVGRATGDEEASTKLLAQTRAGVDAVRQATERLP